ncbi:hypothetical protein RFN25_29715 [Mesorhizobium abyssinicae]|uniref:hypothetical protein n=1 Tax=Mesorhizobium abyssinicae TaxID=1209958 RepID=UPI002A240AE2|nr:hypothetical protein [Mesorhizobium abyssinicae]MDX8437588.1 hypothetical protein [Mesorhizobium abyssinicae]
MLIPIAVYYDDLIPLDVLTGVLGVIVVLMAWLPIWQCCFFMVLISTTGAVFASQNAYAVTAAGIGWSMLLLGEAIPILTWAGLALIIVGLIMVEPKQEAEKEPPLGRLRGELAAGSEATEAWGRRTGEVRSGSNGTITARRRPAARHLWTLSRLKARRESSINSPLSEMPVM